MSDDKLPPAPFVRYALGCYRAVDEYAKGMTTHSYTTRRAGRIILALCSCGASKQFRVENALARAARIRAWHRVHVSSLTVIDGSKKP